MEPPISLFDVTNEHVRLRFVELERRMGLTAIMDSTDRANIQQIALQALEGQELDDYTRSVLDDQDGLLDDVEQQDEAILQEIRDTLGELDGYYLMAVKPGTIELAKAVTDDPRYFRQITYISGYVSETGQPEYAKKVHSVTYDLRTAEDRPDITADDKRVVDTYLERLAEWNASHGDRE
jgi:vacuolar-type H+-ATPase subunit I/STV1